MHQIRNTTQFKLQERVTQSYTSLLLTNKYQFTKEIVFESILDRETDMSAFWEWSSNM